MFDGRFRPAKGKKGKLGASSSTSEGRFLMNDQEKTKDQLIAELTAANERHRQSEENYRSLLEASPDCVVMCDTSGRLLFASRQTWQLLGLPEGMEITGDSMFEYTAEQDRERLAANFARLAEEGVRRNTEYTALRRDGTTLPVEVSSAVIRDSRGQTKAVMGVIRDISQRKQAEESLRQSEERFRVAFDESPVGMVIGIGDGVIVRVNRALCRLGNYTAEELTGRHVQEFTHPDDRALSAPLVKKLLAGEIPSFTLEKRFIKKDGRVVWARATTAAIHGPDGKLAFALGILEDIDERKRAREALRQSYDQLQTIYDGMVEGVLITDIETKRFVRANSSMCRMLGYTEEELLAASVKDIHPAEEVPEDLRRFRAAAEGRVSINEDRPVLRKDGTIFYADISGHPVLYDGRSCLLALFRDVSERREAQEALRRERRTLLHLLRAGDHERQLIAYDIHDGLTQQLAAAMMQLQTYEHLKKDQPGNAKTAYDAGVQMLKQAHFEARRLISGVRPPILDESGIVAAIAHLVHEQSLAAEPRIEFQSDVQVERLPAILENAVYRMAQEALANACQHSGSEKVRVSLAQDGRLLRLEVQDWGTGFALRSVPEDRFGLEGIKQRTRLLGGELAIESEPRERKR